MLLQQSAALPEGPQTIQVRTRKGTKQAFTETCFRTITCLYSSSPWSQPQTWCIVWLGMFRTFKGMPLPCKASSVDQSLPLFPHTTPHTISHSPCSQDRHCDHLWWNQACM